MDNAELKNQNNEYKLSLQALEQQSLLKGGVYVHRYSFFYMY